jgi:hypothetical protein
VRERAKRALRLLTRPEELDYALLYPSLVLKDHGDMHLDLRPDHAAMPDLVRVPLRLFLPGAYVKVQPGGRVLLGFEEADPTRPVAYLWEAGAVVVVEVRTAGGRRMRLDDEAGVTLIQDPALVRVEAPVVELAGGGPPVARVGDMVQVGSAVGTIISGSSKVFAG